MQVNFLKPLKIENSPLDSTHLEPTNCWKITSSTLMFDDWRKPGLEGGTTISVPP